MLTNGFILDTGLKDSDGRNIMNGDILRGDFTANTSLPKKKKSFKDFSYAKVVWDSEHAKFALFSHDNYDLMEFNSAENTSPENLKIIGHNDNGNGNEKILLENNL